jgi:hypothetical protein
MAKLRSIGTIAARQMGGTGVRRTLALVLAVALALTSVAPAWAIKVEVEVEGEGSAPPGTLPGLEAGPELEGEETALGEEAPLPGEEGEEEVLAPAEPEAPEPEAEAPAPEAAPVEASPPEVSVAPEVAPPPSAPPTYEAEASPAYAPEAAAPAVVQGEAIVGPAAPRRSGQGGSPSAAVQSGSETAPVVESPPPAAPPAEAPEPAPSPPATPAAEATAPPGALQGHRFHTVRPGESLWSIATALLPPGAGNAEIVAEVHRLWRLNESAIGTGDPNLLYIGTRLRLG